MTLVRAIEERIRASLGLQPRRGSSSQLERELTSVQRELGLSAAEVAQRIEREPRLVLRLASALTVEETFFLRHPEHFEVLTAHVRERLAHNGGAPLLIWSAGCASGEEPYSIAMAIDRSLGREALGRVQIIATDVNVQALQKGRRGLYGPWSFRGLHASSLSRYFEPGREPARRLIAPILAAVEFRHRSLEQELAELAHASVDVAFFRNVAIYLTEPALTSIYTGLARVLKEAAPLLLGPADPLPTLPVLTRDRVGRGMVFRKQTRASAQAPTVARASTPLASPRLGLRAEVSTERVVAVARGTRGSAPTSARKVEASAVSEVQGLADRGQLTEALARLDQALDGSEPRAELLGLRGRIRLLTGDSTLGMEDLRAALLLDPTRVVLRFHYALGLDAIHKRRAAKAQLSEIVRALEGRSETDVLDDGESTVVALRSAAQELLRRLQ